MTSRNDLMNSITSVCNSTPIMPPPLYITPTAPLRPRDKDAAPQNTRDIPPSVEAATAYLTHPLLALACTPADLVSIQKHLAASLQRIYHANGRFVIVSTASMVNSSDSNHNQSIGSAATSLQTPNPLQATCTNYNIDWHSWFSLLGGYDFTLIVNEWVVVVSMTNGTKRVIWRVASALDASNNIHATSIRVPNEIAAPELLPQPITTIPKANSGRTRTLAQQLLSSEDEDREIEELFNRISNVSFIPSPTAEERGRMMDFRVPPPSRNEVAMHHSLEAAFQVIATPAYAPPGTGNSTGTGNRIASAFADTTQQGARAHRGSLSRPASHFGLPHTRTHSHSHEYSADSDDPGAPPSGYFTLPPPGLARPGSPPSHCQPRFNLLPSTHGPGSETHHSVQFGGGIGNGGSPYCSLPPDHNVEQQQQQQQRMPFPASISPSVSALGSRTAHSHTRHPSSSSLDLGPGAGHILAARDRSDSLTSYASYASSSLSRTSSVSHGSSLSLSSSDSAAPSFYSIHSAAASPSPLTHAMDVYGSAGSTPLLSTPSSSMTSFSFRSSSASSRSSSVSREWGAGLSRVAGAGDAGCFEYPKAEEMLLRGGGEYEYALGEQPRGGYDMKTIRPPARQANTNANANASVSAGANSPQHPANFLRQSRADLHHLDQAAGGRNARARPALAALAGFMGNNGHGQAQAQVHSPLTPIARSSASANPALSHSHLQLHQEARSTTGRASSLSVSSVSSASSVSSSVDSMSSAASAAAAAAAKQKYLYQGGSSTVLGGGVMLGGGGGGSGVRQQPQQQQQYPLPTAQSQRQQQYPDARPHHHRAYSSGGPLDVQPRYRPRHAPMPVQVAGGSGVGVARADWF